LKGFADGNYQLKCGNLYTFNRLNCLYSKSSLTLNEWRFNLNFPWVSMLFLNNWIGGFKCRTVLCDYSPSSYSKTALSLTLKASSDWTLSSNHWVWDSVSLILSIKVLTKNSCKKMQLLVPGRNKMYTRIISIYKKLQLLSNRVRCQQNLDIYPIYILTCIYTARGVHRIRLDVYNPTIA
jgi:hypothetical protein